MARHELAKKRSIHTVCEYFEPIRNTAMGTQSIFEICSNWNNPSDEVVALTVCKLTVSGERRETAVISVKIHLLAVSNYPSTSKLGHPTFT